jgi:DNA polymerase-1
MAEVAVESVAPYAVADAEVTLRLLPIQQQDLKRVNGEKLLYEIDLPLTPVLADMEMAGISLDLPFFQETGKRLEQRLSEIEKQVYESVGKPFNINSTQQLRCTLQPPSGLSRPTATRPPADISPPLRGRPRPAARKHSVVDLILEHRELSKLKSTYVDALQAALNSETGCVHTSYSQIGAVTGRLSSSNPNLQNIPIRSEEGRRLRHGFIASKGNVLLSADYSQIELRSSRTWLRIRHAGSVLPRRHPCNDSRRDLRHSQDGHQEYASARQSDQSAHLWNVCIWAHALSE